LWVKRILPHTTQSGEHLPHTDTSDVPAWVKELVAYHKDGDDDALEEIKQDFFGERIFVFTPKGDVIDLPIESTVIDFAYNIHSDIGNHTSGAKVNGKFVSIFTTLHNGDVVEVETKQNSKPTRKWLEVAKSTIAKKHIRILLDGKKTK
jgi:GTP pyrophosphokinase